MAKENGAFVVEINPDPTPLTYIVDGSSQEKSGVALPALLNKMRF